MWLSVQSIQQILKPDVIYFHYTVMPESVWFDAIAHIVKLNPVSLPNVTLAGQNITKSAHKSDFVRNDILLKYGGIYLDLDVIVLHDMKKLREAGFPNVYGKQRGEKNFKLKFLANIFLVNDDVGYFQVNNAVMISEPGNKFLQNYIKETHAVFRSNCWSCHSVVLLSRLVTKYPDDALTLDYRAFNPLCKYNFLTFFFNAFLSLPMEKV
jgi:hypothetical protein